MFLFSHPWTGLIMTCTGLICLSGMGLTIRSTLRLGQNQNELPAKEPQAGELRVEERADYTASAQ
jgi:hypothetical protein